MNPLSAACFWLAEHWSIAEPIVLYLLIFGALAAIWYFATVWEGMK